MSINRIIRLFILPSALCLLHSGMAEAQITVSLDSCRAMALRNNKQLGAAKLKREVAGNRQKAARTAYLPKLDVMGGYEFTSRQVSILNDDQKAKISSVGTTASGGLSASITPLIQGMAQQGLITPQQAQFIGQAAGQMGAGLTDQLNAVGSEIVDAFDTDTRHMFMASAMVRQPIYMGGAVTAANNIADMALQLADNDLDATRQNTLYSVDKTYLMVVSLTHKYELARKYADLLTKLKSDVDKMIAEGVATKAQGLSVGVKLNEAEIQLVQVENGLSLAKMLLCQTCGIPTDTDIVPDENSLLKIALDAETAEDSGEGTDRPELRMLQNAVDISKETVKLTRAAFLPQVALTGGYLMTNPSIYNGFERRFGGVWNVGVMLRVPVWNWFEGAYKVRAAKGASAIAALDLEELSEKVDLQVSQCRHKLSEASRRLALSHRNVESAEENLRCANVGFAEGVMQTTEVMEAQTAWLAARTQEIDAQIDLHMSRVNLNKALGNLR